MEMSAADYLYEEEPDARFIYKLHESGFDINSLATVEGTLLHLCLKRHPRQYSLFHALFQCGAEMLQVNSDAESPYYMVIMDPESTYSDELKEIFKTYYPGLWHAVEQDDIQSVRKAINLWCRVDILKNNRSLKQLALSKGTQDIISLISNMESSLTLVHAVMADDIELVKKVLAESNPQNINPNICNLGWYGATPICYAIQLNNSDIVKVLLEIGASLDAVLTLEDESEMPILFLALRKHVSLELLTCVLEHASSKRSLDNMKFKSKSILHFALQEDVEDDSLKVLLKYCSAKALAARNAENLTAFDMCNDGSQMRIFDENLTDRTERNEKQYMLDLVANGYQHFWNVLPFSKREPEDVPLLRKLKEHVLEFVKSVEHGDLKRVKQLIMFPYGTGKVCVANCRATGDGQPPLHKAVLRMNKSLVQYLASIIVGTLNMKIDNVKDQFGRTALFYAYAHPSGDEVGEVLIEFGASEFVVDKDNRSPLSFKEKRNDGESSMRPFIMYHMNQTYSEPEPELWTNTVGGKAIHCIHNSECAGACRSRDDCSPREHRDSSDSETEDDWCTIL